MPPLKQIFPKGYSEKNYALSTSIIIKESFYQKLFVKAATYEQKVIYFDKFFTDFN